MFTKLAHFRKTWTTESGSTLKVLRALTDASLAQAVAPEDRTLGRVAWHLVTSIPDMTSRVGLRLPGPSADAPMPASARAIADGYEQLASSLVAELEKAWTDEDLEKKDEMYGQSWKRGLTLFALVVHQTHHRGQMTVLMRQAGLKVPGVYGPAREEWSTLGLAAPEV